MDRLIYLFHKHPLSFYAEASSLLPILIGAVRWRQANKEVKLVVLFFVLNFIKDFISDVFAVYGKKNLFIYNGFSFIEIIILGFIYYNVTQISSRLYRQTVLYSSLAALLINGFFFRISEFSTGNFSVVWLYGILLIMFFYSELLSRLYIKNILTYSMFWISNGLLLYLCGTFFIFLLSDVVLSTQADPETFVQYWYTNLIFYIILSTLASIGIWLSKYDYGNLKPVI